MKIQTNSENHLVLGGCDAIALAEEFGTPLYVFDEGAIREKCREYKEAVEKYYGSGMVFYASKAFNCKEIARIVQSEGLGIDVASGGELYTVLSTGFAPQNITLHGNNKSDNEIDLAVKSSVGRIVCDNREEFFRINEIAKKHGKIQKVLLRVKPGIDAHTHEYILTGNEDSKFGLSIETGEAMEAIKDAIELENLLFVGIHCHIGSQIFEVEPFVKAAEKMTNFALEIRENLGIEIDELDLGGGFGVEYTGEDDPKIASEFISAVNEYIDGFCRDNAFKKPFITIEPGRSIVAAAGTTLYTVGAIKDIPSVRRYVIIDGGMADNPRHILYDAKYTALAANRAGDAPSQKITLAGKCCESGDLIGRDMPLADVNVGDTVAVLTTGAYNYSMASNYNRLPRPAAVMVKDGAARVIIKRESYEDLIRNDC